MDPDTVLSTAIENAREGDLLEVAWNLTDLLDWLAHDGFKPGAMKTRLESLKRHLRKIEA